MSADPPLISHIGSALGNIKNTISLHEAPSSWLDVNIAQVLAIVDDIPGFSRDQITGLPLVLYPSLTVYVLACLKLDNDDTKSLASLKENISHWATVEMMTQLTSHQLIQSVLWGFLSCCGDHIFKNQSQIEKIVRRDTFCLVAQVLVLLSDSRTRRQFMEQKGPEAQELLDLLQALLDSQYLGPARPSILTAILRLSKESSIYPRSLILHDVKRTSDNLVAEGSFGDVWKGLIGVNAVAIKVIRNSVPKACIHEAVLWRQFRHPNILPFYGIHFWSLNPSRPCLVSPWIENGNIVEYIKRNHNVNRTSLLLDVAHGLEYLHTFSPPVIHGDLKGTNILITSSLRACIADFGLCTLTRDEIIDFTQTSGHTEAGALRYQAPEILICDGDERSGKDMGHLSLASDIYSFGCVCYELFARHARFSNLPIGAALVAAIKNHPTPKPASLNEVLWDLIKKCWEVNPELRPTISGAVQNLTLQLNALKYIETPDWSGGLISPPCSPLLSVPILGVEGGLLGANYHTESEGVILPSVSSPNSETISLASSINNGDPLECRSSVSLPRTLVDAPPCQQFSVCSPNSQTDYYQPLSPPPLKTDSAQLQQTPSAILAPSPTLLLGDQTLAISNEDTIVAVMGPTGTGKSSFINYAMHHAVAIVSDNLDSCTQDVRAFGCLHPNGSGRKVVIVDTPGFDDSERTDYEVLKSIVLWLERTYQKRVTLTGILQFHSIAESRMRGTPRRNLEVFQQLCGVAVLRNVILTTTYWDRVSHETGLKREDQLKSEFWEPMIHRGSRVARFYPSTYESAWKLIDSFENVNTNIANDISKIRPALRVQIEMVDQGKKLHETSAFKFLIQWWEQLIAGFKKMLKKRETQSARQGLKRALKEKRVLEDQGSERSPSLSSFIETTRATMLQRDSDDRLRSRRDILRYVRAKAGVT